MKQVISDTFSISEIFNTSTAMRLSTFKITCLFIVLSILCFSFLSANEEDCYDACECTFAKPQGYRALVGFDVYHVNRKREGGTKQPGWLYGVRALYDHVKRYNFYWASEASYAQGTLHGKSGSGARLKSLMRDATIEARFGYTFQCKDWIRPSFTPFFGVGALWETNWFKKPSPLPIHFNIAYRYATVGFLSSIDPTPCLQMGFNVKLRYMIEPECKVTHDPQFKRTVLNIENDHIQYRLEFPVTYYYEDCSRFSVVVIPFYEHRFYGRLANFPFDFLETQFSNYGATFALQYVF